MLPGALPGPALRPRRLARPRTPPFHGDNTGSNPVGDAIQNKGLTLFPAASPLLLGNAVVTLEGILAPFWVDLRGLRRLRGPKRLPGHPGPSGALPNPPEDDGRVIAPRSEREPS